MSKSVGLTERDVQAADEVERRLAAILAADVAGYSHHIASDDRAALAGLTRIRQAASEEIATHRGALVDMAGDSCLAHFASVTDAVTCAIALQRRLAAINEAHTAESRMELRIGIHLGDLLMRGREVFGDGVNIAARLQAEAEPGGICLSASSREHLASTLDLSFEELGELSLKNIPRPVRAYRLISASRRSPEPAPTLRLADKPSIAVLPFTSMPGDPEQEFLADGITEDIITALGHIHWFRLIARNSTLTYKGRAVDIRQVGRELGARYVLEGSMRRSGQLIRISAQLIDAASASQIWAERFEAELKEAFAVQDAIAERIAGAIEPELLRIEAMAAAARHGPNVTAWDLVHQGTWNFRQVGRATHLRARELFRQAAAADPELAEAHCWLARVSAGIVAYGWSDQPATDMREGLDAALQAIQLDETNPYSHYAFAICSAYANAPEQAVLAAERAIELSRSFALAHLVHGLAQLFCGNARGAIAPFERGLMLNAFDPQNFVWYNLLALAHLFAGEPDQALAAATKARKVRPAWRPIYETLLCCHVALGQSEQAAQCLAAMRGLESPAGDTLAPLRSHNPEWAEQLAGLLAKGGLAG